MPIVHDHDEKPRNEASLSFISICVARGVDWPQIAEWVGHVSPKTTKLYTHFNTAESKKRMESMDIRF